MSIVKDQLEQLLKDNHLSPDQIIELGHDNFSLIYDDETAERMAEKLENADIKELTDITYDDEEGDVIVHFEGNEDDEDSKSIKSTDQVKQLHAYLVELDIEEPDDIIESGNNEFDLIFNFDEYENTDTETFRILKEAGLEPKQEGFRDVGDNGWLGGDDENELIGWYVNITFDGTDKDGNQLDANGKPVAKSIRSLKRRYNYIVTNKPEIKAKIKSKVRRNLRRKGIDL